MTNAYLNLPGHCFVNEINIVENVEEQDDVDHLPDAHNLEHQTPAYVTNNNPTQSQPDSSQPNTIEPNQIDSNQIDKHGITLEPDMLSSFGFTSEHNITLFITQGRIVITTHPKQLALMTAIEELQLRQDEILTDFTVAIEALKGEI